MSELREISTDELKIILDKHALWLEAGGCGERANLRSANLSYADLSSANLRYADLSSANLSSADLRSADLSSANLRSADLSSANLSYANLRSANLRSANLRYANLRSANLRYANLSSATGQYFITQRSDGYQFFLTLDEDGRWMIRAGCQYLSIEDYRKHTISYSEDSKRIETVLILDFAEAKLATVDQPKEEAA